MRTCSEEANCNGLCTDWYRVIKNGVVLVWMSLEFARP